MIIIRSIFQKNKKNELNSIGPSFVENEAGSGLIAETPTDPFMSNMQSWFDDEQDLEIEDIIDLINNHNLTSDIFKNRVAKIILAERQEENDASSRSEIMKWFSQVQD